MHKYLKVFLVFALALAGGVTLFNLFGGNNASDNNSNQHQYERAERRKPRRPPPPPRDGFPPRVFDELNLTDEQKAQIENLQSEAKAATDAAFEKIRSYDEQLQTIISAESFDEAAARQILNEKSQTEIELQIDRLKTENAVKSILNDEQKAQYDQMKKPRRDRPHRPMPPREEE